MIMYTMVEKIMKNFYYAAEPLFPDIVKYCIFEKTIVPYHVWFITKKMWWYTVTDSVYTQK